MTTNKKSASIQTETVSFEEARSIDDRKVFVFVTVLEAVFVASFLFLCNL